MIEEIFMIFCMWEVQMMIRSYIKNVIYNSLNYDVFGFEDFHIDETTKSTETKVRIAYDNFFYIINLIQDRENCEIYYNPGLVLSNESGIIRMKYFEREIVESIHNWLLRTKTEMLNPVQERYINMEIQNFREQLDVKLREVDDSFFTKAESEELKERLDILEQMIVDEKSKNTDLQSDIDKMRNEIEFLKNTVDKMEKKKWFKYALLKMWNWSQKPENQNLIEAGVHAVSTISKVDFSKLK